jgi:parallel beta-helix repeat protein
MEITTFEYGIWFASSSNNSVNGNNVTSNGDGIVIAPFSDNNSVIRNTIAANTGIGIQLFNSSDNSLIENDITDNWEGIMLILSPNNSIIGNTIAANGGLGGGGIRLPYSSDNNTIYHNNFIENTSQAVLDSTNVWDDGYPSGGNYWSDYNGTDSNGDGIGDTPYVLDANNTDRYPLMAPYGTFDSGTWNGTACSVGVMSNSTISYFRVDLAQKTLSFNVTGAEGSTGFCRVTIPNIVVQNLWQGNYTVLLDGKSWPFTNWTDPTNTYVYFNYTHSQHQTVIIPELPSSLILPMLMIVTLIAIIASRRKWLSTKSKNRR